MSGRESYGSGGNVREHVTRRRYEMSPDPSGKGKRKITGEPSSAGKSAGQEQLHRTGDFNSFAASSGKGKRKLHVEDHEDLQTGLHRDAAFYPTLAEHRKSRSEIASRNKRHRLPDDTGPGPSANTIEISQSPMPTGEDRTSRRSARVRYGRSPDPIRQGIVRRGIDRYGTPGTRHGGQCPSGGPLSPINLDDIESPRGANRSIIELEDEPSGRSQQLAEDERMARELQAELNGRHRDRARWRGHGLGASLADDAAGSSVRLVAHLSMQRRMDVLAALESALQDHHLPLNLRLASLDRDFNENDYEMLLALDDDNHMKGASAEHIQQLPVTVLQRTDVSDEACVVCLEVPVVGDHIRRLPCMHSFHQQCIDKWLQTQAVCPVCKAHI